MVAQIIEREPPPESVNVAIEIPPDLPPVYVYARQMEQVLNNLVINAYHAMPEGGELTISAHVIETSEVSGKPPRSEWVALSITDTGYGISKENIKKLFDPLYTTKERGIGLGLTVCKSLVELNRGSIEVESEEEVGSTFTVRLPVAGSVIPSRDARGTNGQ